MSQSPAVTEQRDDRSPFALACQWSARVTSISLEAVVPILIGYWLDRRLHSSPVFLMMGVVLGFVASIWGLLRLAKPPRSDN